MTAKKDRYSQFLFESRIQFQFTAAVRVGGGGTLLTEWYGILVLPQ